MMFLAGVFVGALLVSVATPIGVLVTFKAWM